MDRVRSTLRTRGERPSSEGTTSSLPMRNSVTTSRGSPLSRSNFSGLKRMKPLREAAVLEIVVQQSVEDRKTPDGLGLRIKGEEPLVRTHPYGSGVIFEHLEEDVRGQQVAAAGVIALEASGGGVEAPESSVETRGPDVSPPRPGKYGKEHVERTRIVLRPDVVRRDFAALQIVAYQSVGIGRYPESLPFVLVHAGDEHALESLDRVERLFSAVVVQQPHGRAYEQFALCRPVDGEHALVKHRRGIAERFVFPHGPRAGVEPVEPLVGSEPQRARFAADRELRVGELVVHDPVQRAALRVVEKQTLVFGGDPDAPRAVVREAPHEAVFQRTSVGGVVLLELLLEGAAIVHSSDVRADPDAVRGVDEDREGVAVRERKTVVAVAGEFAGRIGPRVVAVHAFAGGHPDDALPIDVQVFGRESPRRDGDQRPDTAAAAVQQAEPPPGAGRNFDVDLYFIIRDSYDKIKKVLYDF